MLHVLFVGLLFVCLVVCWFVVMVVMVVIIIIVMVVMVVAGRLTA